MSHRILGDKPKINQLFLRKPIRMLIMVLLMHKAGKFYEL